MKTLRLALAFLLLAVLGGLAQAASSYTFRSDSYAWETAANTLTWDRTCTSYPGDDDKATISLTGNFKFKFAGTDYTAVRVLANGGLQFGTDTGFHRTFTNTALPAGTASVSNSGCAAAATTNVILAYWTDLNPSQNGSGGVTWEQKGTSPNRYLVVSWNGVYQYNTSTPYTFQIILYENGEFKFQYGNANASGSNATIGVQVDGNDFTQYSYNSGYNANGSAIRWFVPSGTPTRRAEYRFDEWNYSGRVGEVADSSGNSNNGVRVGNATTSATSKVCRSLSIPADTTATSHAVDTLLDVNSGIGDKGAVTFWYQANTAWNNSAAMLLDATTSTGKPFFLVRQADGSLRATVTDSNGVLLTTVTPVQSVAAATWRHIAVTWKLASGTNQSILRIYINGSQVGATTLTTSGTLDNTIGTLFVGDNRSGTAPTNATLNSANGLIDEMRVYNYEISALELTADMATVSRICLPPLDHYELSVPTSSLTCTPTTVTVRACSSNASSCSVETSINGTAVLTTTAGTLSNSVVSFNNGVATATLSLPGGADGANAAVSLSAESTSASNPRRCCPDGVNCAAANSCSTTFNRAGFIIAAIASSATSAGGAAVALPPQTAGTASNGYYLRAVRSNTSTQACEAAVTGSRNVNWAYRCNDPATCSGSNLMTVTTSTPTVIQRNNASASASYTAVPMVFDAYGNAPFSFTFADVGQVTLLTSLGVSVGSAGTDTLTGSSGVFVTKPAGFTVTTSASSGAFAKAGAPFAARITAVTSSGATTPNFGKEAAPEGVLLKATLVAPIPAAPASSVTGTVGNATVAGGAFTNGVANVNNLSYSEVGIMKLTGSVADADYLGGGDTSGAASADIGRFTPFGFTATLPAPVQRVDRGCPAASPSAFTYLDENFQLKFTLSAVNAQGNVTRNYAGAFANLALGVPANFNLAGVDTATGTRFTGARLGAVVSAGAWPVVGDAAAGTAVVTLNVAAMRGAAPDGPFTGRFGIAALDTDNVGMFAFDLDTDPAVAGSDRSLVGQIPLRYGRLRLQNGMAAINRPLTLPLTAQYWDSGTNTFKTNNLDSCTSITASNLSFGNFRKTLVNADAAMTATTSLAAGSGVITLAAPGNGHLGSMDIAIALDTATPPVDQSCLAATGWAPPKPATQGAKLTGLRGGWCAANNDPSARATWGLYRGSDGVVFQRENY